jgi:RHH-type transcriptional regulator, proline utilization regulon repressor / proline dehydrogenase / delta 1-pyrroline-5-carboxylate dehydrogenase
MEHSNRPTDTPLANAELASADLTLSRHDLREAHVSPAPALLRKLVATTHLDEHARRRIHLHAKLLASAARRDAKHEGFALGLVHRFGLNTPQGIALMQLAEALPRTTDTYSARMLMADKIGSLSWRDALGAPSFGERLALHVLDTFSKTFREAHDGVLQGFAQRSFQKAIAVLSRQYVLGETLPQALRNGRSLARTGYRFSFDMLGEAAMTDSAALNFQASYLHAVDVLAAHRHRNHAISVKLSALHPRFEERQRERCLPVLLERVKAIAIRARAADLHLTLDAEESDRLELTLDVFEQLLAVPELQGWNGLGLAVQAYQRRAYSVIDFLAALSQRYNTRINVRLVKGAYWDTEIKRAQQLGLSDYPIYVRKCDTDVSYLACARRLLEQPAHFYSQFATHNAHTVAAIAELSAQAHNKEFEFQRLHGMGQHLHSALLHEQFQSRIYAPIGPRRDLLPYLVRRLLENGASSSFVRQLTDTSIPIETLVRDPITIATDHSLPLSVGAPTDVRQQMWPAAQGLDLTARDTSAALATLLHIDQSLATAAPLIGGVQMMGDAQPVTNPAQYAQVIGHVVSATKEHATLAVTTAQAEYVTWCATTASTRAALLERAAQLLEKRAPQFIKLAVREAGKTIDDAIGEVREAVDFCRYYAEQCRLPAMQQRQSLGVVVCISPWNFPLAIFLGQVSAALAAGNTVVAKPAEQTPLIAMLATQLLHEAGIPTQALQLVTGDGGIGATVVAHPDVAAVCFTGSVATAKAIGATLAQTGRAALPFIAETGGINAMIVDSSSLPEQVVRDVLASAFQSAGQRCSALRILCLQEEIAEQVLSLLHGAIENLRVGDPSHIAIDVGPLIDADAQQQVQTYLATKKPFAQAPVDAAVASSGWYVAPTIIEVSQLRDVQQEIFGPVLHVMRFAARNLPALVQAINAQCYGLTLGIHSRIRSRVQSVVADARVGNLYVNRHQVGAVVGQQPFGGHGLSGTGPKAGGPHYLLRMSRRTQAATSTVALHIADHEPHNHIATLLADVRKAQFFWERTARRSEMVQFACQLLAANTSQPLGLMADRLRMPGPADLRSTLASIAGETNELYLKPRGVLLCFSTQPDPAALAAQILLSVATGNGVLVIESTEQAQVLRELLAFLRQSGVPDHLVAYLKMPTGQIAAPWLTTLEIDGVVFDGSENNRHAIANLLQQRSGAILPLLCSTDDMYRFCLEQTVTVNTAAAGGDPHLLGMGG